LNPHRDNLFHKHSLTVYFPLGPCGSVRRGMASK